MHLCAKSGQKLIWNCNQNSVLHNPQSFSFICSVCIPEYSSVVWVLSLFEESANSNNLNGVQMYACIFPAKWLVGSETMSFDYFELRDISCNSANSLFDHFHFDSCIKWNSFQFWTNFNGEVLDVFHIWAKSSTPKRTQKRVNACMSLSRSQRIIA